MFVILLCAISSVNSMNSPSDQSPPIAVRALLWDDSNEKNTVDDKSSKADDSKQLCCVLVRNMSSKVIELPRLLETYTQHIGNTTIHSDSGASSYPDGFIPVAPKCVHVLRLDIKKADKSELFIPLDVYINKKRYRYVITIPLDAQADQKKNTATIRQSTIKKEGKKNVGDIFGIFSARSSGDTIPNYWPEFGGARIRGTRYLIIDDHVDLSRRQPGRIDRG